MRARGCDVKLSASSIQGFAKLDWKAPNADWNAQKLAREMIADFMNAYRKGGNDALSAFHDKEKPLLAKEQFEGMIPFQNLPKYFPKLHDFLMDYPKATIPEAERPFTGPKSTSASSPLFASITL